MTTPTTVRWIYTVSKEGAQAWLVLEEDDQYYYCLRNAVPTEDNGKVHAVRKGMTYTSAKVALHNYKSDRQLKTEFWVD